MLWEEAHPKVASMWSAVASGVALFAASLDSDSSWLLSRGKLALKCLYSSSEGFRWLCLSSIKSSASLARRMRLACAISSIGSHQLFTYLFLNIAADTKSESKSKSSSAAVAFEVSEGTVSVARCLKMHIVMLRRENKSGNGRRRHNWQADVRR